MDDGTSWRRGVATPATPDTAATELDEGGAMSRTDLEPEDLAAIISVLEYVITNFRSAEIILWYRPPFQARGISK